MSHPASIDMQRVRFGIYEVDWKKGELLRSGIRVRVQNQPFKLLQALLEKPGELVLRTELQSRLWGSDTTVDFDHSLGIAATKLREALNDSAENPRFIETVPKQGYRFIAPVQVVTEGTEDASQAATAAKQTTQLRGRWRQLAVVAMVALAIGALATLLLYPVNRSPYHIKQTTYSGRVLASDPDVESFSSLASDGMRLYFSQISNGEAELSIALAANGEITHFDLPTDVSSPLLSALAPDSSRLLIHSHLQADPEQPLWIVPTLGGDALRVPHVLAHDATWMPDGTRLLVASGNELTTVDPDGRNPRRLLRSPGPAFWMRWSPDRTRLRYTVRNPNDQTTELWEVAADGSNPHPLLPGWNHPASECCGSWTSDGKYFVFQSSHDKDSEIWVRRERPWFLPASRPWRITNGPLVYQSPSPMPGSDRIHFIGVNAQIQLLKFSPESPSFSPLDLELSAAALVSYSRDGKWVAWLNAADGSVWRSRTDGSERTQLTAQPLTFFSLRWSADSRQLALMGAEPGRPWKIYLIDTDGGELVPILSENRNEADPDWSPDSQTIVFGRPPNRMDNQQSKAIYLLNLKTHQLTEIPGSTGLFSPRFSPDGRYIAAIQLDQHALRLFDRVQQRWTTLTEHGVGDPVWSHDGHFVYFQDILEAGKPVYRIAVPNGQLKPVMTMNNLHPIAATDYRLIGLAPGDLPIVSARTSRVNLYSINLDEK